MTVVSHCYTDACDHDPTPEAEEACDDTRDRWYAMATPRRMYAPPSNRDTLIGRAGR